MNDTNLTIIGRIRIPKSLQIFLWPCLPMIGFAKRWNIYADKNVPERAATWSTMLPNMKPLVLLQGTIMMLPSTPIRGRATYISPMTRRKLNWLVKEINCSLGDQFSRSCGRGHRYGSGSNPRFSKQIHVEVGFAYPDRETSDRKGHSLVLPGLLPQVVF